MCGDATNWDEEVYRESILKEREIQTRTVWAQSLNPSPETVVVASSYGSVSSYSIPFLISKLIQGWRWKDCEELCVPVHLQGKHVKPVLDLVNPQHKGPWGALSPIPENNALAVDNKEGCIFSAAGDSCVYCWDVVCICSRNVSGKRSSQMTFKGHAYYVHSVIARNSTNQKLQQKVPN